MSINNYGKINTQYSYFPKSGSNIKRAYPLPQYHIDVFEDGNKAQNKTHLSKTTPICNLYSPKQLLIAYSNPDFLNKIIEKNPNIKELMQSKGINPKVYPENIANICNSHIATTTFFALQIANKMNISQNEKQLLEQACVFHDFGKILIPPEILEKPGILSEEEKEIVDLHAQLGYELLSKTGMNKRVLNLIKNHHNPMTENSDVLGQILSVADIYSALREARSYKNTMPEKMALNLLDQKTKQGEVSTEVVNALKEALASAKSA